MYTKKIIVFLTFFLSVAAFITCSGPAANQSFYKNIRYYITTVRSVDNKIVTLSDGSRWKTNRFVITANLSDAMIVLEEYLDVGYLYVNNTQYSISSTTSYSDDLMMTDLKYLGGYLDNVTSIDSINNRFELSNGTLWECGKTDMQKVKNWNTVPEVVISLQKELVINPREIEVVRVIELKTENKPDTLSQG